MRASPSKWRRNAHTSPWALEGAATIQVDRTQKLNHINQSISQNFNSFKSQEWASVSVWNSCRPRRKRIQHSITNYFMRPRLVLMRKDWGQVERLKRIQVGGTGMCRMISSCWRTDTRYVPVCLTRHLSPIKQKPQQARQWQQTLWAQNKSKDTLLLGRRRGLSQRPLGES